MAVRWTAQLNPVEKFASDLRDAVAGGLSSHPSKETPGSNTECRDAPRARARAPDTR